MFTFRSSAVGSQRVGRQRWSWADDPALVAWCEDLYETYRDRGRSPAQRVLADLKQWLAETVPAVGSAGDE